MTAYAPSSHEKDLSKYARSLQQLAAGRSNGIGTLTLAVSATTTTVVDHNCASDSGVFLCPTTADAAAAMATTYLTTVKNGSFTFTHANNTQADRTFIYAIIG